MTLKNTSINPTSYAPLSRSEEFAFDLTRYLKDHGIISNDGYQIACIEQQKTGLPLEKIYLQLGFISESVLRDTLICAHNFKEYTPQTLSIDNQLQERWSLIHAEKYRLIPAFLRDDHLDVVMVDGFNIEGLDTLKTHIHEAKTIVRHIALEHEFQALLKTLYEDASTFRVLQNLLLREGDLLETGECSPDFSASFIQALITHAIEEKASDLHFEIESRFVRTRLRIDGVLRPLVTFHQKYWPSLAVRLKVIADLNIADTRMPQNGRCTLNIHNREVDLRVSTHPTFHAEDFVIRILDQKNTFKNLNDLGFEENQLNLLKRLCRNTEGMILVTGPTGAGKTTTLYGLLNHMQSSSRKIMTLEQPVEYTLSQVRQTAIHEEHGLGFADGVRSILRQDPDIIMIGEIRDETTAQMALRASLTGHLVFSTLHTKDALGTLSRLKDLEMSLDLLGSNIIAIISQRLVRKVCRLCCTIEDSLSSPKARGCIHCDYTGYKGRTIIAEILPMNHAHEEAILEGKLSRLRLLQCCDPGHQTLKDHADILIKNGITTSDEVSRVINYPGDDYAPV